MRLLAVVVFSIVIVDTSFAAEPRRVLVMETQVVGVPAAAGPTITGELAEQLAARPEVTPINLAELDELLALEQDKRMLGCTDDIACLAKISAAANAELVLSSSVGKVGESVVFSLTLVDARKAEAIGRVSETIPEVDAVLPLLPKMLAQLFGWEGAVELRKFQLPEGKKLSFAVFDLQANGVDKETAKNLTHILSAQIGRIEGTTVITGDDVDAMLQLEEEKLELGCTSQTSCMAEIGGALGVDKLVIGQVGKLTRTYVVSLRLIDVRTASIDSRITESFKGQQDQLLSAIRYAGMALLGVVSDEPGTLAIAGSQSAAEVVLDDEPRGELPLPPIRDLTPGQHTLSIEKPGYYVLRTDVYVEPGGTTAVWTDLDSKPTWWAFWGSAGGTALSGVGAVTFGLLANYNASEFRRLAEKGTRPAARTRAYDRAQTFETTANVLIVSTAVLGVAAGVLFFLTDWE